MFQEEGEDFQLGTTLKRFRGTITLVAGDNLGSQLLETILEANLLEATSNLAQH